MSRVQVKRERFMPFRSLSSAVEMQATQVLVDGEDALEDCESDAELRLDGQPWKKIELRFALSVASDVIAELLPEHELSQPPLCWAAVLEAPRSRVRRVASGLWRTQSSEENDVLTFMAHFDLLAQDIAGPVTISPWLVRSKTGTPTRGYGSAEGHRLAGGRSFTLHTDPVPIRSGKFLDVRYKAFSQDPALREGFLYHLETIDEPVLWINSDHASIAEALDAKGQTGVRARLREVFFDTISGAVWTQLFLRSVDAVDEDGGVRKPWQGGVLMELLPHMFPKTTDHASRVRELLAARNESLGLLAELCDRALQGRGDVVKHMSRLIERASAGALS